MAEIKSRPAEWPDGYKRPHNKGTADPERRPHREKLSTAPFIAWDGEGYTDDDGEHHYMLFGNSVGESVRGASLDYRDCFPLLLEPRHGINVIFGGDYDIIMMIRHMPKNVRERLHSGKPVKFDGYRMVWYRRKMFFIKHYETNRSTVLYDCLSFFQCSFVKACREYLGDDDTLAAIHEMKLKRDSFVLDDGAVDIYWQSELLYLVKLMDELRRLLTAVGIKPKGWYGPGAVANGLMTKHQMKRYIRPIPDVIVDIGERAYYGGRFEQFKVGKMDGVYQYDIRSAYPKALAVMPDFFSAEWQHFTEKDIDQERLQGKIVDTWLYCVSWDIPVRPWRVGPLPWRSSDTGNIYFPMSGHRSWYWGIEIRMALAVHPKHWWTVHEVWVNQLSEAAHTSRPFGWVQQMYDDRAAMKAAGNPAERALKLGMNSLYGKLAQSKGARYNHLTDTWRKPAWHNILAAGFITAYTRATIFNALRTHETDLIAIETDALFLLKPASELKLSTELGDWECTELESILYVHSGVYYALRDGDWKLKSRGVEADKSKSVEQWREIFAKLPHEMVTVTNHLRRFGTDNRQPKHYAHWYEFDVSVTMPTMNSKRIHVPLICPTCVQSSKSYAEHFHWLYVPTTALGSAWTVSAPYKLPWRKDVKYVWPSVIRSDVIEDTDDLTWSY